MRAALDTVSEAVELADSEERSELALRKRGLRRRVAGRVASRRGRARATRRLGTSIGTAARRGVTMTGRSVTTGGRWLSTQVLTMAPRLPVRDLATLRGQYPDRTPDEIADALIEGASRASATVGVAVGAWSVLPFIPAVGVEIATETLSVVGIEIKLVAELHEAYGTPASGKFPERMSAYVAAWAHRRGVSMIPGGVIFAAGSPLTRLLRRRLAARAGRSAFSLGPLLTGAAAGAILNGRETRKLGQQIRNDLRRRALTGPEGR